MGGKVRDRIRAYAWIGGDRPHEIGDAARFRRSQGFSAVKMNATAELDWIGNTDQARCVLINCDENHGLPAGAAFFGFIPQAIKQHTMVGE